MENIKNKIKKLIKTPLFKQNNKTFLILITGCIGLIFIALSELLPAENTDKTKAETSVIFEESVFETELEGRLESIISQIRGAGKTKVMITVDSSKEYFYATDISEDIDSDETKTESETVIIDGENGEEPIVIKTVGAKIRGVFVVCEGGDDPVIKEKIIKALCALLDIQSNQVSVTKLA